jgi:hypothetical protein
LQGNTKLVGKSEAFAGADLTAIHIQSEGIVCGNDYICLDGVFSEGSGEIFAEGSCPKRSATTLNLVGPDPLRSTEVEGYSARNEMKHDECNKGVNNCAPQG